VDYSAKIETLAPDTLESYIHAQLDIAGLPHHTFTDDALHLVLRVSEGVLRAVRNLCAESLIALTSAFPKT